MKVEKIFVSRAYERERASERPECVANAYLSPPISTRCRHSAHIASPPAIQEQTGVREQANSKIVVVTCARKSAFERGRPAGLVSTQSIGILCSFVRRGEVNAAQKPLYIQSAFCAKAANSRTHSLTLSGRPDPISRQIYDFSSNVAN